jgi:hypothetical protein
MCRDYFFESAYYDNMTIYIIILCKDFKKLSSCWWWWLASIDFDLGLEPRGKFAMNGFRDVICSGIKQLLLLLDNKDSISRLYNVKLDTRTIAPIDKIGPNDHFL